MRALYIEVRYGQRELAIDGGCGEPHKYVDCLDTNMSLQHLHLVGTVDDLQVPGVGLNLRITGVEADANDVVGADPGAEAKVILPVSVSIAT